MNDLSIIRGIPANLTLFKAYGPGNVRLYKKLWSGGSVPAMTLKIRKDHLILLNATRTEAIFGLSVMP